MRLHAAAFITSSLATFSHAYFPPYSHAGSHAFTLQTHAESCGHAEALVEQRSFDRFLDDGLALLGLSPSCPANPLDAFNAADHTLNLLGNTKTTCPAFIRKTGQCPQDSATNPPVAFNTTIPLPTSDAPETGPGLVFMDATVPFGQQLYVRSDGLLEYTRALAPHPPQGAYLNLFTLRASFASPARVQLLFNHTTLYACPPSEARPLHPSRPERDERIGKLSSAAHGKLKHRDGVGHGKRVGEAGVERIYARTPDSVLQGCRPVQAVARAVRGSGEVFEYN